MAHKTKILFYFLFEQQFFKRINIQIKSYIFYYLLKQIQNYLLLLHTDLSKNIIAISHSYLLNVCNKNQEAFFNSFYFTIKSRLTCEDVEPDAKLFLFDLISRPKTFSKESEIVE